VREICDRACFALAPSIGATAAAATSLGRILERCEGEPRDAAHAPVGNDVECRAVPTRRILMCLSRLRSAFSDPSSLAPRRRQLVRSARRGRRHSDPHQGRAHTHWRPVLLRCRQFKTYACSVDELRQALVFDGETCRTRDWDVTPKCRPGQICPQCWPDLISLSPPH